MAIKFSTAQLAFLTATGTVRNGKLTIEMSALEEAGPSRTRSSLDEKRDKFNALVGSVAADEKGRKVITALGLHEAGLPSSYMTNAANWSGVSEGSELAYDLGFSSKYGNVFDPTIGGNRITVTLTPLTDKDREKRAKQRATAAAKEQEKKAAAAEPEGAAESVDEHGIPNEHTEETGDSGDEQEEAAAS